jgi:hypothetical protein
MAVALAAELLIRHGRNFNVQIDTIEQRSADLGEIALDDAGRAAAFARDITVETARTPVQVSTARLIACIGCPAGGGPPNVDGIAHPSDLCARSGSPCRGYRVFYPACEWYGYSAQ